MMEMELYFMAYLHNLIWDIWGNTVNAIKITHGFNRRLLVKTKSQKDDVPEAFLKLVCNWVLGRKKTNMSHL